MVIGHGCFKAHLAPEFPTKREPPDPPFTLVQGVVQCKAWRDLAKKSSKALLSTCCKNKVWPKFLTLSSSVQSQGLKNIIHVSMESLWKSCDHDWVSQILLYWSLSSWDHLTCHHPETKEYAPTGCLWETQTVYPLLESDGGLPSYQYCLVALLYINPTSKCPQLLILLQPDNFVIIQHDEAAKIPQWTPWPKQQHYQMKVSNDKMLPHV